MYNHRHPLIVYLHNISKQPYLIYEKTRLIEVDLKENQ